MFIEQDNDVKFLKEYFVGVSFPSLLDIAYTDEGMLEALKSPNEKARILEGVQPPSNSKIQVLTDAEFAALEGALFDCVASRNALHFVHDTKKAFAEAARLLKKDGSFIISDIVTDTEDAYLNSFQFRLDKRHVRFYTVVEIVAAAAESGFALEFFKRIPTPVSLKQSPEYAPLIAELPENILSRFSVVKDSAGQTVGFSQQKGIFIFKKI